MTADVDAPALAVERLSKRYGPVEVLRGVSFDVARGEVVGLVGANGAGKSTLIKILSGAVAASAGQVRIAGAVTNPATVRQAARAGVQTVHQEIGAGVIPGATVAENLTLDSLAPGGALWRSRRRTRAAAREIAAAAGLGADLEAVLDRPIEELPTSERQQVVIARALSARPRLLVLDEPTATLSTRESERVLASVGRMAAAGVAVLYVSHRLAEIERICERVVVLRDGVVQRDVPAPFVARALAEAMLGGTLSTLRHEIRGGGSPVLEARGVRARPDGAPFDLVVRAGEVVGITGLVGSGQTELLEQLYGARRLLGGTLSLRGRPYAPQSPADAVRAGVGLVAESRAEQIVPTWSVRRHVTLPRVRAHSRFGLMDPRLERATARRTLGDFGVVGPGADAELGDLSGGNQQKVLVGRWFDGHSTLVLLDEPFRGVDVGARADIAAHLRERAHDIGLVVASSDPAEILQVADRVVVMADGGVSGELRADQMTTEELSRLLTTPARHSRTTDARENRRAFGLETT
ncbi:sugar ABC transporter ATP-binding protein [Frankia nepalensis]|uniref:Sugar ABC transporter ATP-binding protein n=1 Tax=Frankia nepalensis TaxID=1836974 RepID=A0A937RJC4_9ACTN|nr:sugar ABC transporter ATP-binding protein [Frankia nepalensis]MBL7501120.1 sugar ABC transporter ATP-binding protein [Frankia nepalensis]MBL7515074.1 sugar ABC transporter ATP-binding protein [Frankia nepalensis]MBL7631302.1 sugar ABC transporter ATP-binding protein [Frankia nepalensis]